VSEESERVQYVSSTPFEKALVNAFSDPADVEYVRMFTRCLTEDGTYEQVEIFGNGVMIWNGESQTRLPALGTRGFIYRVYESGFADMPESFGGDPREQPAPARLESKAPLRIICEFDVEIDDQRKRVEQLDRGEQSEKLLGLARFFLDKCRKRSVLGVRAQDLGDGLAKVSARELASETFKMTFTEKPELSQADDEGLLLIIRGRQMVARRHTRDSGLGAPIGIRLERAEFDDLVRQLAVRGADAMPANLFAPNYIDLTLEVLNHRRSIQARQFAGLEPNTHGEQQREFNKLIDVVRSLWPDADRGSRADAPAEP
jgi:hypothetical protein